VLPAGQAAALFVCMRVAVKAVHEKIQRFVQEHEVRTKITLKEFLNYFRARKAKQSKAHKPVDFVSTA